MMRIKSNEIKKGDYVRIEYESGYRIYEALSNPENHPSWEILCRFRVILDKGDIRRYKHDYMGIWKLRDSMIIYRLINSEIENLWLLEI